MKDYEVTREELAEFLINMRTSIGLSRPKFAKLIGISNSTLIDYENSEIRPHDVYALVETVRSTVREELNRRRKGVSA